MWNDVWKPVAMLLVFWIIGTLIVYYSMAGLTWLAAHALPWPQ